MKQKVFWLAVLFVVCTEGGENLKHYEPDFSKSDIYLPYLKRLPLSGWWKIRKVSDDRKNNPDDEGSRKAFYAKEFDDSAWEKDLVPNDIHVPFVMNLPKIVNWDTMHRALPKQIREWGGGVWFRRSFTAPRFSENERAILTFDEIIGDFDLFVNGKKIGSGVPWHFPKEYRGPHIPQSFDITSEILPGEKNSIAVRLFHSGEPVRWGWAAHAGITDLVYLDIVPRSWSANILVTPEKNLRAVRFECVLSGSLDPADTDAWSGEIFEWNTGNQAGTVHFGKRKMKNGRNLVSGRTELKQPVLWSCENPFLYGIRVRNARGEITGIQRFGMRTFGIQNGNFVLNGKPVALRGWVVDSQPLNLREHGWFFVFRSNVFDLNRRYWKLLVREGNVNHVRMHSKTQSRGYYDILDEFGVIVTDELDYPETRLESGSRAEMIDIKGFDGACREDGSLRPAFRKRTMERIWNSYSHPCICTYSFGNEIRQYNDPRVEKLLNNLYDLFHAIDEQNRPTTNSSGRFWANGSNIRELSQREKFDYIDVHDYTGSIGNLPLAYCEPVARAFLKETSRCFGIKMPPVINGEVVYFGDLHYRKDIFDGIWETPDASSPNWEKLLYMFYQWPRETRPKPLVNQAFYWLRNWGTKGYRFSRQLGRGFYTERIVESYRKLWPEYDGYEILGGPYFELGKAWPFEKMTLQKGISFSFLQKVNAPLIAISDYIAPNRFTDEKLALRFHVLNHRERTFDRLELEVELNLNGKSFGRKLLPIGTLVQGGKQILDMEMTAPPFPAQGSLVFRILSDGKKVFENQREIQFRLRDRSPIAAGTKKIALYDVSAVFGKLKPHGTGRLLKRFAIPFQIISSFEGLKQFDILVIGSESLDETVQEGKKEIRDFVKNGGRLLVFEQNYHGRIPFLPDLEYVLAGSGQFAEVLKSDHPALKSLEQKDFFCWNQADWAVYHSFIVPISPAALLIGGDSAEWGAKNFGMVAAHLKLGKGDILLSQTNSTSLTETDSSAALFSRRLLETILDDRTRPAATHYKGLPPIRIKPVAASSALFISLRDAATMGFRDRVASDGKGGWTDQGPKNDLAAFPTGKCSFSGFVFDIPDPERNNGRACVAHAGHPGLKFSARSRPIPIHANLKRLLFLHAGAWIDNTNPSPVGRYVITYDSGETAAIPLIPGDNIADWWDVGTRKKNADCVWRTMNGQRVAGVFLFEWRNPHPEKKIRDVVLEVTGPSFVGLLGLTGEKL